MVQPSFAPSSVAPPAVPPSRSNAVVWLVAVLAVAVGLALGAGATAVARRTARPAATASIVRVVLDDGEGTGFVVAGPDGLAYVVTAYHVVDRGGSILVERAVQGSHGRHWTEAYPDAEVVAFDADADLAVIRLRDVSADSFTPLPLAAAPVADEPVLSYGFPASSLAARSGMVSKPGKILSEVKFPVLDHRAGEVVRSDAIDGLLVSSEIEPGFSGGPSLNARGELVGVNVTKDTVHRAQNGAVSVTAVKALLALIDPRGVQPTADDVKRLLERIQNEYLLLPVERRWSAREDDYVSTSDLPRTREMIAAMRRLEADTSRDPKTKLSGQATLGLMLARLPGRPLETYTDAATRAALADCEQHEQTLRAFFGALTEPEAYGGEKPSRCSALAFRPMLWDLTAMAMRWQAQGAIRVGRQGRMRRRGPARVPGLRALRGNRLPRRHLAGDRWRPPAPQALRQRQPAGGAVARAKDGRLGVHRDLAPE